MVRQKNPKPDAAVPIAPLQTTDPFVRVLWPRVAALGAVAILPHDDSGGYVVTFPFPWNGITTPADVSARVLPAVADIALGTSFGAGRGVRPDCWYLTLVKREKSAASVA